MEHHDDSVPLEAACATLRCLEAHATSVEAGPAFGVTCMARWRHPLPTAHALQHVIAVGGWNSLACYRVDPLTRKWQVMATAPIDGAVAHIVQGDVMGTGDQCLVVITFDSIVTAFRLCCVPAKQAPSADGCVAPPWRLDAVLCHTFDASFLSSAASVWVTDADGDGRDNIILCQNRRIHCYKVTTEPPPSDATARASRRDQGSVEGQLPSLQLYRVWTAEARVMSFCQPPDASATDFGLVEHGGYVAIVDQADGIYDYVVSSKQRLLTAPDARPDSHVIGATFADAWTEADQLCAFTADTGRLALYVQGSEPWLVQLPHEWITVQADSLIANKPSQKQDGTLFIVDSQRNVIQMELEYGEVMSATVVHLPCVLFDSAADAQPQIHPCLVCIHADATLCVYPMTISGVPATNVLANMTSVTSWLESPIRQLIEEDDMDTATIAQLESEVMSYAFSNILQSSPYDRAMYLFRKWTDEARARQRNLKQ